MWGKVGDFVTFVPKFGLKPAFILGNYAIYR